jgi:hypothetical protein
MTLIENILYCNVSLYLALHRCWCQVSYATCTFPAYCVQLR